MAGVSLPERLTGGAAGSFCSWLEQHPHLFPSDVLFQEVSINQVSMGKLTTPSHSDRRNLTT